MDPLQFIWEVAQAIFSLIAAVALPVGAFWLIARRQQRRQATNRPDPRTRDLGDNARSRIEQP